MKKLFSKIESTSKEGGHKDNHFIGKVFNVGRTTVTVEDVLAEGMYIYKNRYAMPIAFNYLFIMLFSTGFLKFY